MGFHPRAEPEADVVYPGRHLLELAGIRPIAGAPLKGTPNRSILLLI
jgi:hypothetical protein